MCCLCCAWSPQYILTPHSKTFENIRVLFFLFDMRPCASPKKKTTQQAFGGLFNFFKQKKKNLFLNNFILWIDFVNKFFISYVSEGRRKTKKKWNSFGSHTFIIISKRKIIEDAFDIYRRKKEKKKIIINNIKEEWKRN